MASRKLRARTKSSKPASAEVPQNVNLQAFAGVIPLGAYALALGWPSNQGTRYFVDGREIIRTSSIHANGTWRTIATLDPTLEAIHIDVLQFLDHEGRAPHDPDHWYIGTKETVATIAAALDDVRQARTRLADLMAGREVAS